MAESVARSNEKRVGIGEVAVDQGNTILTAYGVGSCVVITLYDRQRKIGGLAHCLLPNGNSDSLKYPHIALDEMLRRMSLLGMHHDEVVATIVGGAAMFQSFGKNAIGKKNVAQAREELKKRNIEVIAEDVYGTWGRSVLFNLSDGSVTVRSFQHGEHVL